MKCPKCHAQMLRVEHSAGVADRCSECEGLWFDMGEDQDLHAHADAMDSGDAARGARFNQIDNIRCPVCPESRMLRMVDALQPHIWFESCPTCYGRFYDAGEFRDVAEKTLSDMFKRWRAKERE